MALYWGNKHRSQASSEDGVRGGAGSIDKYGEVSEHRAGDHSLPATRGRESFWSDVAPTPPSATRRSRAFRDLGPHVLFLLGVAFNGGDEIGNQIGAALILVLDFRPGRLGRLLLASSGATTQCPVCGAADAARRCADE